MSKSPSPLLGFNNNVRHKGQLYHIQTEDSGVKYPHVITHLFGDGGRILKTLKTSYAHLVGSEDMATKVRAMMKEQHKAMFIALRNGDYDDESVTTTSATDNDTSSESARPDKSSTYEKRGKQRRSTNEPNIEKLERAAEKRLQRSELRADIQPVATPTSKATVEARPSNHRGMRPSLVSQPPPSTQTPAKPPSTDRPFSDFATAKPSTRSGSVFGERVLSKKSLDEVILKFISQETASHDKDDDSSGSSS